MNTESTQEQLFQEPIGVRLRQARLKSGLSVEQVGQQLKLPVAIVQAMEVDDWPRLGAPVYVRSYLGSYLRLVGLPPGLAEEAARTKPAPELVTMASHSRLRHALSRSVRNAVYLVMTAVLVVPAYLVARQYQSGAPAEVLTLETTPASLPAPEPIEDLAPPRAAPAPVADDGPPPVMASMAPFKKPAAATTGLVLRFSGESWFEAYDADGVSIERALVGDGAERRYAPGQVARITLGRADAVEVSFAGRAVDLSPYRAANVARFTVNSDGEPAPAGN
jgi:cytoskeleton protein RodZ